MLPKWFYMECPNSLTVKITGGIAPVFKTENEIIEMMLTDNLLTTNLLDGKLHIYELTSDGERKDRYDLLVSAKETNAFFAENRVELILAQLPVDTRKLLEMNSNNLITIQLCLGSAKVDLSQYFPETKDIAMQYHCASFAISSASLKIPVTMHGS